MTLNIKQKILLVISISLVAIIFFIGREGAVTLFTGSNPEKVPVSALRRELTSVSIPEGHKPRSQIKVFDRGIATGATQHFQAPVPVNDVVSYYEKNLVKAGWTLMGERYAGGERIVKFCKQAISLTLDAIDEGGMHTFYYLGVVWVESKSDRAHCAKS